MAKKLGPSDLITLSHSLKKHIPGSLKLYGLVSSLVNKRWKGFDIWVDNWPDYSAVLSSPNPESWQSEYDHSVYSIFVKDIEGVERLLYHPDVVNWKKEIVFGGVSKKVWDILKKAAKDHGGHIQEPIEEYLTFIAEEKDLPEVSLPDDVTLGSVTADMADMVSGNWEYAGSGSQDFIRSIMVNFPSVCLFNSSGEVIGYELVYPYGSIGFLYVIPECRRQGYGKLISVLTARKLIGDNQTPWVYIEEINSTSIDFHRKLGFKEVPDGIVSWLQYKAGTKPTVCCSKQKKCCV